MAFNFPTVDDAIALFENVNPAYNNPGALAPGTFSTAHGATGAVGSIATFPSLEVGRAAEDALVSQYAAGGATLSSLINSWNPSSAPGNSVEGTQAYIDYVSGKTGLAPSDPISNLTGATQAGSVLPGGGGGLTGALDSLRSTIRGWFGLPPIDQTKSGAQTGTILDKGEFSFARVVSILVGLVLIAGGLYLFKPASTIQRVIGA